MRRKQYRKLMHRYAMSFNFREPYQVLIDADILRDTARFKMDLAGMLERTLQGKVKPMVTQCTMRHLYTSQPPDQDLIASAKNYERRRCNHHTLEEPLSTLDCFSAVVDSKGNGTNKNRYIVASQDLKVRAKMRTILGVPLIYVSRSVMIMEPMADASKEMREREEKGKFRAGLKTRAVTGAGIMRGQRKREDGRDGDDNGERDKMRAVSQGSGPELDEATDAGLKRKRKGPKGPNPLSVKKPKKSQPPERPGFVEGIQGSPETGEKTKRKRKRKRKDPDGADETAVAA